MVLQGKLTKSVNTPWVLEWESAAGLNLCITYRLGTGLNPPFSYCTHCKRLLLVQAVLWVQPKTESGKPKIASATSLLFF